MLPRAPNLKAGGGEVAKTDGMVWTVFDARVGDMGGETPEGLPTSLLRLGTLMAEDGDVKEEGAVEVWSDVESWASAAASDSGGVRWEEVGH
jgi:hypothetical protein